MPPEIDSSASPSPEAELQALLASRAALIVIESRDEARVLELVHEASLKARRGRDWGVFQWTVTEGLLRIDRDLGGAQKTLADPAQLLRHLKTTNMPGIYVLLDFHPYLAEPLNVRTLKDIAQGYSKVARTLVLTSHALELPVELEHLTAVLRLALPDANEREAIVLRIAGEWTAAHAGRAPRMTAADRATLVQNLSGLTARDVERLARNALFDDGALTERDFKSLLAIKYQLLNRGGTLTFEADTARFAEVGGMQALRRWITQRKPAFDGSARHLDSPKGILLLGVQGCGKSLAARAAAGLLGVPILRLDFSALYSKWHGESEKNLRESLASAEALAPCVLWIDEIEKAVASGEGDSGVSRRVLGTFLTWLAEQRARIFVVATANDIASLPPELVRKGRFDEIFFVDLPDDKARLGILEIHARKRGVELTRSEAATLAVQSVGFSGAELEQAIVSALYTSHAAGTPVTAAQIAAEIEATRPLSVVMGEKIAALRAWAAERTVAAD
ncbi:MAG: AAA family ATPase [Steroidobacteraceae bacterium]|nr:AAA family ATPase [Steroidobacteraceae bacterium]